MDSTAEPTNLDTETSLFYEIQALKEGMKSIKEQNRSLERNISLLTGKMNEKFDRMEACLSARNDETVALRSSLSHYQNKVGSDLQSLKSTVFVLFSLYLLTCLYSYYEDTTKEKIDWYNVMFNLYRAYTRT